MSSHPEIHAQLEQIAHARAADEDTMLRGMSLAERDAYWGRQDEWDELMRNDIGTLDDMVALYGRGD